MIGMSQCGAGAAWSGSSVMLEHFINSTEFLAHLLEGVGILVILGGFIVATVAYVSDRRGWGTHSAYVNYRRRSVRGLILGLEFLIAADIVNTVAVDYSLQSVLVLGLIVLIRSFLVFALHVEIEGWPFRASEKTDTPVE